jgi:hypothetical protein
LHLHPPDVVIVLRGELDRLTGQTGGRNGHFAWKDDCLRSRARSAAPYGDC